MVIPSPDSKPLEVRSEDGQVIAYIVSVEEMNRLRGEIESLREQLAVAVQQRDHHLAKREEAERTLFPLLPNEEEMADASRWATSEDIQQIITDLESQ
jgi:hypothetical protein